MSLRSLPALLSHRSAVLALALAGAACSGSSGDNNNAFVLRTADHGVQATSAQIVSGGWMVYFADEATSAGDDLNLDGDALDQVAVAVNLSKPGGTVLRAAVAAAIVSGEVYLVVDEAEDGTDWDGDVADNLVLLHWSNAAGVTTFVDVLDPDSLTGEPLLALGDERLIYASASTPVGDETTLRTIERTEPLVPVTVLNAAGGGALAPLLLTEIEGLVFLLLDETTGPAPPPADGGPTPDYNLDGDNADDACLALLDGTEEAAEVVNVFVAMGDAGAPLAARRNGIESEWLVAFLVNEAAQGATNLNDPLLFANPLVPDSCAGTPDVDTADDVLFYGRYEELILGDPPVNTGLVGGDRVVVVEDYVATISDEADATCDLNADLDSTDRVARWVETVEPVAPPRDPSQLHALFDVAGGSHGLSPLAGHLVIVADEAADDDDINGDTDTDDTLVGFLDPGDGFAVTWTFSHPDANPGTGVAGVNFVGANWMAAEPAENRLGLAFMEEVAGFTLNVDLFCDFFEKDPDAADSLPIWADITGGGVLDFDGQGYALQESDPGIVQARGFAFYRVSEASDDQDYNNDGDKNDAILFRNPQTQCSTVAMGTASSLTGVNPVIVTDAVKGAVYLASEFQAGIDFNGDGDSNDLVPRWFVF